VLSVLFLRKRYAPNEYVSVVMVSVGILLATFASAREKAASSAGSTAAASSTETFELVLGIGMLLLALVMSAGLGIMQEVAYARYGKHTTENMFYSHLLSLPCFLLVYDDIWRHVLRFQELGTKMWLYLLGNVLTQYICSRGVFTLMSCTNALTLTMAITLRKFISLLVSIFYFGNHFTAPHWLGTILVFGFAYTYSIKPPLFSNTIDRAWQYVSRPRRESRKND